MRITVPSSYMVWPRGMGGLGQGTTASSDNGTVVSPDQTASELASMQQIMASPITAPLGIPTTSAAADESDASVLGAGVEAEQNTGLSLDSYITNSSALPSGSNSGASSASQLLTAAGIATAAAAKGITAASGPWQVPGTSLVYNPATGQIINAYGQTVGTYGMTGAAVNIGSFLPLIIGGLVIFMLIGSTRGK